MDLRGDDQAALRHYDRFMREIAAQFENAWRLTSGDIGQALGPASVGTARPPSG